LKNFTNQTIIMTARRFISRFFAAAAVSAAVLLTPVTVLGKTSPGFATATVAQTDLPKEAQATLALIQKGGPFPYKDKDGSTFGNREGLLPKQPRGYYSEYTVKTRATKNRGAIRIIAGKGKTGQPETSGEYYYTDDHYASFKRIMLKP
jgi:ribonuclease T1